MSLTALPSIRQPSGSQSTSLRPRLGCLALSALLMSASAGALADDQHNLYLMFGSGDYSEEVQRPDTATLIDEGVELQILGYGYRFSEHHEVVFQVAQSKIGQVNQRTFTSAGSTSRELPDIDLQTFSVLYKPQLPLGSATFYGLAGFTRGTFTPDVEDAEEERETDLSLGLGWSFRVLPFLELQIEYLRFFGERNDGGEDNKVRNSGGSDSLKPDYAMNAINFGIALKF